MREPKAAIRQLPKGTNSEIDQQNVTEARTEGGNTIDREVSTAKLVNEIIPR